MQIDHLSDFSSSRSFILSLETESVDQHFDINLSKWKHDTIFLNRSQQII